jgi:hypothetical protein
MERDQAYLLDMLESARLAGSYVVSITRDEFLVDVQWLEPLVPPETA